MASSGVLSFIDMPVQDVMTKEVKTIEAEKPLVECIAVMNHSNIGSVIVVDGGKAVGIFTERDLVRKISGGAMILGLEVSRVMTKPLKVISPNTTLWEAITMMGRLGIRRLPVVEDGKLVGILTETDILRLVLAHQNLLLESVSESLPTTTKEQLKTIAGHFGYERPSPRVKE